MKARTLALLVAAVIAGGCRAILDGGDTVCQQYAAYGIHVEVLDSITRAAAVEVGTLVIAREGAYADSARWAGGVPAPGPVPARPPRFGLAEERPGTYDVTVERPGYRVWQRTGVRVLRDECHVKTVSLTALLQRLP